MQWQGDRFEGQVGLTVDTSTAAWPLLPRPSAGTPNVLMIVIDDIGFGHLGCYGSRIDTPNIDKLAASGVRLEQFYVMPLCTPTRAALLTGRYPLRYGLQTFVIPVSLSYGLATDERTPPAGAEGIRIPHRDHRQRGAER